MSNTRSTPITVFTLFLLLSVVPTLQIVAQDVYAIIACPTQQTGGVDDAATNQAGRLSRKMILNLLEPLGRRLKVADLSGAGYDGEKLLSTMQNCRAGPQDTVFVYLVGHGSFDPENRWTVVVNNDLRNGQRLVRGDLTRVLRSRSIRLGILITESCASVSNDPETADAVRRIISSRAVTASGDQPETANEALERLFLRERGTVDLAACKVTQLASFNADGPFFLRGFCAVLQSNVGNGSWEQVFANCQQMVKEVTGGRQEPVAITLPTNTGSNKAALGVSAKATNAQVFLTRIIPNSPASRVGLRTGDVIESINGEIIRTTGEFLDAIHRSPIHAVMVIKRDGREVTYRIRLSR